MSVTGVETGPNASARRPGWGNGGASRTGEQHRQEERGKPHVLLFSSRRRHTRYWRDWSSDVCSSDLDRAKDFVDAHGLHTDVVKRVLDLWERTLRAIGSGDLGVVEREIDWVIKQRLVERYRAKHDLPLSSPRIARLDLAYHDIHRERGLYYPPARRGLVERVTADIEVFEATAVPPQTTRAKLRGDFVRQAQERRRDFTVDWVHLKLNDQAQRTVLCKDPFRAVDERVERLIQSM